MYGKEDQLIQGYSPCHVTNFQPIWFS